MSDLFDSLDLSDLDEIAGKLKVGSLNEEKCITDDEKKKLDKIPAQLEKSTKKHAKQAKDLRSAGIGEQVADLFANYMPDEETVEAIRPVHPSRRVEKKPLRQNSFVESAAQAISHSVKNKPKYEAKPLRETVSIEERIKLLEQDLFRVQAQATPNTLVAGIGASLDSGGGAVWLWDLEDVNIGTPLDGVYPAITNGSVLVYDSNQKAWVPGAGGGASSVTSDEVSLTTPITDGNTTVGDLPAPGNITNQDAANSWFKSSLEYIDTKIDGGTDDDTEVDGDLKFDGSATTQNILAYGAGGKRIALKIGSTENAVVEVMNFSESGVGITKPVSFATGQAFPGVLPLAGGAMTGTITFASGQTFPGAGAVDSVNGETGTVVLSASDVSALPTGGGTMTGDITFNSGQAFPGVLPLAGGAIAGDTTYAGATSGDTNLQTKASVNALIAGATGGGFTFKGTTNVVADTAPGSPDAGDFYINTTAGTAGASWTGIAGSTISADQLIIYSGSESRWFAGAVEDNSSFLLKTGGTMTGDITFASTQNFNGAGGSLTNNLTLDLASGNALTVKTDGTTKGIFKSNGNIVTTKIISSGSLLTEGDIEFDSTTSDQAIKAYGKGTKGLSIQVSNDAVTPTYTDVCRFRTSEVRVFSGVDFIKDRSGDGNDDFQILGRTADNPTGTTDQLFRVFRNVSGTADALNYFGLTTNDGNIQTKASVQALIDNITDINLLKGGTIRKSAGSADNSGNLIIQSAVGYNNYLRLQSSDGTTNLELAANTGHITMGDDLVMTSDQDNKLVQVLGATNGGKLRLQFGQSSSSVAERVVIDTTTTLIKSNFKVGENDGTENFKISSQGHAHFMAPNATVKNLLVYGATSSKLQIKTGNVDENSSTVRVEIGPAISINNATLTINRSIASNSSGEDIIIKGCTKLEPSDTDATLLQVFRNAAGNGDAMNYYGRTVSSNMSSPGGNSGAILEHTDNLITNRSVAFNFFQTNAPPYHDYNVMNSAQNGGVTQLTGTWSLDSNYNEVLGMVLMYINIGSSQTTNLTPGMKIGQLASDKDYPGHTVIVPCAGENDTVINVKVSSGGLVSVQNIVDGGSGTTTKQCFGSSLYPARRNYRKPA